jgi:hypothetical protein
MAHSEPSKGAMKMPKHLQSVGLLAMSAQGKISHLHYGKHGEINEVILSDGTSGGTYHHLVPPHLECKGELKKVRLRTELRTSWSYHVFRQAKNALLLLNSVNGVLSAAHGEQAIIIFSRHGTV